MAFLEQPYGELSEGRLRLMTWNLWARFGPWEQRQSAIVATIEATAPDVLALQECWFDERGGDQATVLGDRLGFEHCSGGGELLFGDWGPCSAILSRWPIAEHEVHQFAALQPDRWGGVALRAVIDGPRGELVVYSVALDWPPHASATRTHSLRQLAALVQRDQQERKVPVFVAGDFNAPPDSDEIRALTGRREAGLADFVLFDAWEVAGPPGAAGVTWSRSNPWAAPSLLPDRRIDYVFTTWPRRGGAGSAVEARLAGEAAADGVVPSDHYAVVVDLRY